MSEILTTTSNISNRTAAFAMAKLLMRALPLLVFEKFGQTFPLPTNSTKIAKFRRFEALDSTPNELNEGVTPTAKQLSVTDVTATLRQYGDLVIITDVVNDTNEDPVLSQAVEVLGEQAAQMLEKVRFGILKAGTNVYYANGTARSDVNTAFDLDLQRKVLRALKRQNARPITSIVRSTAAFNTENIAPSFVAICHPDVEADLRDCAGFVSVENYGTFTPFEGEIGSLEGVRYIASTIIEPWEDAGATAGSTVLSTSGTNADVYPILYIAKDAYGIVPLKGKAALTPTVLNPGVASKSDPLGQRGYVGWKAMQTCVILNQAFMVRAEVAVSAL
jgi:N4-gp56 family major capsid protein